MLQEDKIKVGKYSINYVKVGHGAHSVLCLPGTLGTIWSDFKHQIEGFDREKFTLVVWDAPGFGKSRPPEREFSSDYYAQDVDIAVEFMKALNISKFSLLGWCYGGVASIHIAAKYPEAVNKLVVWGARARILPQEMEYYKLFRQTEGWSSKMLEPKLAVYGEELLEKLCSQCVDAMECVYRTNGGEILSIEVLSNVRCPTLIIHGEKDPIIDKDNIYSLLNKIQGARIFLYPEGKHNIHIRFAEDFNQRVQEFLLED